MAVHNHGPACIGTFGGRWVCEMNREELLQLIRHLSADCAFWQSATDEAYELGGLSVPERIREHRPVWARVMSEAS